METLQSGWGISESPQQEAQYQMTCDGHGYWTNDGNISLQLGLKKIFSCCISNMSNLQSISVINFVYYSCVNTDWSRKLLDVKVQSLCEQVESGSETIPQPPSIISVMKSFHVSTKHKRGWKDPPRCRYVNCTQRK